MTEDGKAILEKLRAALAKKMTKKNKPEIVTEVIQSPSVNNQTENNDKDHRTDYTPAKESPMYQS